MTRAILVVLATFLLIGFVFEQVNGNLVRKRRGNGHTRFTEDIRRIPKFYIGEDYQFVIRKMADMREGLTKEKFYTMLSEENFNRPLVLERLKRDPIGKIKEVAKLMRAQHELLRTHLTHRVTAYADLQRDADKADELFTKLEKQPLIDAQSRTQLKEMRDQCTKLYKEIKEFPQIKKNGLRAQFENIDKLFGDILDEEDDHIERELMMYEISLVPVVFELDGTRNPTDVDLQMLNNTRTALTQLIGRVHNNGPWTDEDLTSDRFPAGLRAKISASGSASYSVYSCLKGLFESTLAKLHDKLEAPEVKIEILKNKVLATDWVTIKNAFRTDTVANGKIDALMRWRNGLEENRKPLTLESVIKQIEISSSLTSTEPALITFKDQLNELKTQLESKQSSASLNGIRKIKKESITDLIRKIDNLNTNKTDVDEWYEISEEFEPLLDDIAQSNQALTADRAIKFKSFSDTFSRLLRNWIANDPQVRTTDLYKQLKMKDEELQTIVRENKKILLLGKLDKFEKDQHRAVGADVSNPNQRSKWNSLEGLMTDMKASLQKPTFSDADLYGKIEQMQMIVWETEQLFSPSPSPAGMGELRIYFNQLKTLCDTL